jgi:hypothetical protein
MGWGIMVRIDNKDHQPGSCCKTLMAALLLIRYREPSIRMMLSIVSIGTSWAAMSLFPSTDWRGVNLK